MKVKKCGKVLSLAIYFVLGVVLNGPLSRAEENVRMAAHQKAYQELDKLHFVKDGRGMVIAPDFIRVYEMMAKILGLSHPDRDKGLWNSNPANVLAPFKTRWGIVEQDGEVKGFFNVPYKNMQIGAMGCIVCHNGKVAGQYILGLGNKNIDVGQIATDAFKAQTLWQKVTFLKPRTAEQKLLDALSLDFAKRLSDSRYNNLTQGMVPVSMIRQWFFKNVGNRSLPEDAPRSAVKVPHLWGYAKKRFIGQFSDGFGDGSRAGWGLAVELAGTQSIENTMSNIPKIAHAEDVLGDILPPSYPFAVNQEKAKKGKEIYTTQCMRCHGDYQRDESGIPIFQEPKHIPWYVVKTDDDRLKGNDEEFFHLVDTNPVNSDIRRTNLPPGFFAPRLEAVWARFPYLHNASVPSMMALLTAPEKRPKVWSLVDAGEKSRFDEKNMGLTLPIMGSVEEKRLLQMAAKGTRDIYSTERIGHSAQGHWFSGQEKMTEEDKYNLIEYLKTL